MDITLNGEATRLAPNAMVADAVILVTGRAEAPGCAVAVDGAVVPRSAWAETPLAQGARVDVVTAFVGG